MPYRGPADSHSATLIPVMPAPDPRWASISADIGPDGQARPVSFEILAGRSSAWADVLPARMIVDGPGRLLRLARSQFALAWFDHELMTAACLTGFQAVEAAFRALYPETEKKPFRTLIHRAHNDGILPPNIAKLADAGAELRNGFSHPLTHFALAMNEAESIMENAHRLVALIMDAAAQRDARWRAQAATTASRPVLGYVSTDGQLASPPSLRSFEPLTMEHLNRLAELADHDHEGFTRPGGRPEYRQRRVLTVLAQGAARHYLDCLADRDPGSRTGVKDLDVWTFYAAMPGTAFPAVKRETRADFGPSTLGRQPYNLAEARNPHERALWRRWSAYQGRRVDFLMRALPVPPDATYAEVTHAVQDWLRRGAASRSKKKPSAWHLAQEAMVTLTPAPRRGEIVWPVNDS